LFERRDYRNEGHNPFALGVCPSKSGSCSSETKCDKKNSTKTKVVCFEEEITGTKTTFHRIYPGFMSW
jgi:hypothetical protein